MHYLAFDLDGTLLKEDKTIDSQTINYLIHRQSEGDVIILLTSRNMDGTRSYAYLLRMFEFRNGFIITSGGIRISSLRDNKEVILSHFDVSSASLIFDFLLKSGVDKLILESPSHSYRLRTKITYKTRLIRLFSYLFNWNQIEFFYSDFSHIIRRFSIIRFLLYGFTSTEQSIKLMESIAPSLCSICSLTPNDTQIELLPQGFNKFSSLKWLIDNYHISIEEIIYFGDSENDICCLKNIPHSVAMANAQGYIKAYANNITRYDNNSNGIYDYLININRDETKEN